MGWCREANGPILRRARVHAPRRAPGRDVSFAQRTVAGMERAFEQHTGAGLGENAADTALPRSWPACPPPWANPLPNVAPRWWPPRALQQGIKASTFGARVEVVATAQLTSSPRREIFGGVMGLIVIVVIIIVCCRRRARSARVWGGGVRNSSQPVVQISERGAGLLHPHVRSWLVRASACDLTAPTQDWGWHPAKSLMAVCACVLVYVRANVCACVCVYVCVCRE